MREISVWKRERKFYLREKVLFERERERYMLCTHVSCGWKSTQPDEHEQQADKNFSIFTQDMRVLITQTGYHGFESSELFKHIINSIRKGSVLRDRGGKKKIEREENYY